jgi:hypothetical protein
MTFATPPAPIASDTTRALRAIRGALAVARGVPRETWVIALAFVLAESRFERVASRQGELVLATALAGPALRWDAIASLTEAAAATMPLLLLVLLLQAWLLPRYLAAQWRALGLPPPPTRELPYERVLGAVAIATTADVAAAIVAALPGALIWLAGPHASPALALLGAVATIGCAVVAFVYVRLGLLFVTREVIFGGCDLRTAVRTSWALAERHRGVVLHLALVALAVDMLGALGGMLGLAGVLTRTPARVLRDAVLTRGYTDLRGPS